MELTTIILTRNDIEIEGCLRSVSKLGPILVGNAGDGNIANLCSKYKARLINLPFEGSYSKAKNILLDSVKSGWILNIEPWETFIGASPDSERLLHGAHKAYWAKIVQNNLITKEVRLWHSSLNLRFEYPVNETILIDGNPSDFVIYGKGSRDIKEANQIISDWIDREPTAAQPHYYMSCNYLMQKKFKEFILEATRYLFMETSGMSVVMTKYYLASYLLYVGDAEDAVKNILTCIAVQPLMAEFWCLLGDVYYKLTQYKKAHIFYENAIFLGRRRLKNDPWPIEIDKYEKYPKRMINTCKELSVSQS